MFLRFTREIDFNPNANQYTAVFEVHSSSRGEEPRQGRQYKHISLDGLALCLMGNHAVFEGWVYKPNHDAQKQEFLSAHTVLERYTTLKRPSLSAPAPKAIFPPQSPR